MHDWQVKLQIEAMAHMAVIEGMKIDNTSRLANGESIMWTSDHFFNIADELNCLARSLVY